LPLRVRPGASRRGRGRVARHIVRGGRQGVDPSRAVPQTIRLEFHDKSTGTVGRDYNRRITGIYWLIAGASDLECTQSESRECISTRHNAYLNQLVVRRPNSTSLSWQTGNHGRGLVDPNSERLGSLLVPYIVCSIVAQDCDSFG